MPISTVNQKGLDAPLALTSPVLTTPNLGTPSALVLTNATALPKAALPTGSVLQVVNAAYAVETSANTTSDVDTGLTATITPLYSTSKILVLISQKIFANPNAANNSSGATVKMLRGATTLITAQRVCLSDGTGAQDLYWSTSYLDSPASTSAVTYKTTMALFSSSGAATVYAQLTSCPSGITLMEIAA